MRERGMFQRLCGVIAAMISGNMLSTIATVG